MDTKKFCQALVALRQKHPFRRMALLMDNLIVHKTKRVQAKLKELQFQVIYNAPYQPELNAIEYVFSMVKRNYKKMKLEELMNQGN